MKTSPTILALVLSLFAATVPSVHAEDKLKALIIDGQNNHSWKVTTPVLKWILQESGRFTNDVSSTPPVPPSPPNQPKGTPTPKDLAAYEIYMKQWQAEKAKFDKENGPRWQQWRPKFSDYAVVISNYNGEPWPEEVRNDFVEYVRNGGGFVCVHAADNAFPAWTEYNDMIALGGWGGRDEKTGPYFRWRNGKMKRDMSTPGPGGHHGRQHEFVLDIRNADHPITKGLPPRWKHASDELYDRLRGPAKNITVLATAFSAPDTGGTGEHEPLLMVISYGKGRVFHTALGHGTEAMNGVGFQVTLARGAEWAATGEVTLPAPKPEDLPEDKVVTRPPPNYLPHPNFQ